MNLHILVSTVGSLDDGVDGGCEEEDEVDPGCGGALSATFAVPESEEDIEVVAKDEEGCPAEDGEPDDCYSDGVKGSDCVLACAVWIWWWGGGIHGG